MSKVLLIDNYDSFTYNLLYLLRQVGCSDVEVVRNDKFALSYVKKFDRILLSPGPGIPSEAGQMLEVIKEYSPTKSILGVCLGHQGIAEVFGASLVNMDVVVHAKAVVTRIVADRDGLFKGLPAEVVTGRYHSWIVDRASIPACIEITAEDEAGGVMAIRHRDYDVKGLQFHPESILTERSEEILRNWVS